MKDFKHFPRIPRYTRVTESDYIYFAIIVALFIALLSMAGAEDMKAQTVLDEQAFKESLERHNKQVEIDAVNYLTKP